MTRSLALLLGLVLCASSPLAMAQAAQWRLTISGHQLFLFGEPGLGGGLRVPWEVAIEFQTDAGDFLVGSGRARWIDRLEPVSGPPGRFDCRRVEGTYLDSNLQLHQTPRVRFAAFPVAGRVSGGRVVLQPGYEPPGNYLAVTYECTTEDWLADNWFAIAERGKQVLGKRQDAETRFDGERPAARVREVAPLPPESRLDLPLTDGWTFEQGGPDTARWVRYELRRLR